MSASSANLRSGSRRKTKPTRHTLLASIEHAHAESQSHWRQSAMPRILYHVQDAYQSYPLPGKVPRTDFQTLT